MKYFTITLIFYFLCLQLQICFKANNVYFSLMQDHIPHKNVKDVLCLKAETLDFIEDKVKEG